MIDSDWTGTANMPPKTARGGYRMRQLASVEHRGRRAAWTAGLFAVVLTATTLVGAGQADAASNPSTPFRVEYGNTYTDGDATFTNRWVIVAGEQKAVSATDCRMTFASAYDAHGEKLSQSLSSQVTCGCSEKFRITPPADAPGGAAYVIVKLYAVRPNGADPKKLAEATVRRL